MNLAFPKNNELSNVNIRDKEVKSVFLKNIRKGGVKIEAVILAAGKGIRLKTNTPKPFFLIQKKPILIHSLEKLSKSPLISSLILVINKKDKNKIIKWMKTPSFKKIKTVTFGGLTRQESVRLALRFIDKDTDFLLIHDGVRPFISSKMINRVIKGAKKYGCAIVGVPVKSTLKKIKKSNYVEKTIDRNRVWEIQTPQVFRKDLILKAYAKFKNLSATDDASLVERLGFPVKVIKGSYFNIKITTPEDLILAEAIARWSTE